MEMSPFLFGLYKLVKYGIYPLTWLSLFLVALAFLVAFPISPRRLRWIRYLVGSAILVVLIFSSRLVSSTLIGLIEERAPRFDDSIAKKFDAIVVLGGGAAGQGTLRPTDELSLESMERTICGATLFSKGFAPRLLFSGGDSSVYGSGPEESAVTKQLALRLGVPDEAILIENHSRNTYENAVETKRLLGKASILLVTSASHIPRASALFRKQGFDPIPYACGYEARNLPGSEWNGDPFDLIPDVKALYTSTEAIVELVGFMVYRAIGKL
ncbi:MAG: YdcF family protein [Nitrospira sp.]|nr:YdcF family protein [Nitrospira sp.]